MLKEGDKIYYEESGVIHCDKVINITDTTFELENYGCCCEGNSSIDRSMIGYTFFTNEEDLLKQLKIK